MWFLLAIGSAIFAALTSILAKIGIEGVMGNGIYYSSASRNKRH